MATGRNNNRKNDKKLGTLTFALAFSLIQAAGTASALAQSGSAENAGLSDLLAETEQPISNENSQFDPEQFASLNDEAESNASFNAGDDEFFVELHVNDEDLATVLQMLSIQSQRNIIASNNVSATVTANLYGVTFYEALDSVLHVNGFGYIERGNFIYIYTLAELEEIRQSSRTRVSAVINLNYLNATDAAEFASPMLSQDGGQIKMNGLTKIFKIPKTNPVGADNYANNSMLVIYDYPENIESIRELIAQIDTRPAQVLVEATILQTQINENNAFGIDFSVIGKLNFNDFIGLGGPLAAATGVINGAGIDGSGNTIPLAAGNRANGAVSSTIANIGGPSSIKAGVISNNVGVFLRLLDEVSDTTILSNPKILTLNRQPARVLVGRKVGYLSTTSTDVTTTQSVEFLDTGTQLYFRPFISSDGMIRMELKPQVSEAVIRNVTDSGGAAVTIPDEITNELVTNVIIRDGQTIVLGGLFRESTTISRRQVPVLGDLPIIGAAFRGQDDEVQKNEIIFMITPSIVSDATLAELGQAGVEYTSAARAGTRQGLLPFSRERQSQQLMVRAQELAREGKTNRALHAARRAREMFPTMAETYRFEGKITGTIPFWPTRSMLEEIVANEAGSLYQWGADDEGFSSDDGFTFEAPSNNWDKTSPASNDQAWDDFGTPDNFQSTDAEPFTSDEFEGDFDPNANFEATPADFEDQGFGNEDATLWREADPATSPESFDNSPTGEQLQDMGEETFTEDTFTEDQSFSGDQAEPAITDAAPTNDVEESWFEATPITDETYITPDNYDTEATPDEDFDIFSVDDELDATDPDAEPATDTIVDGSDSADTAE